MPLRDHFAPDYAGARDRFTAAARAAGLPIQTFAHPGARGAQGETLSTDVVRIGAADARRLVIVTSGVHGLEGFAGSGCQVALLHDAALLEVARARGAALLLIHAVNPYGFSHRQRTDENNVDLNRNRWRHGSDDGLNAPYADLHPLLMPAEWPGSPAAVAALLAARDRMGPKAFVAAISRGQATHPDGLFYMGRELTWSSVTLETIVRAHAAQAADIAWIDVHTGLGPSGHGERIFAGSSTGRGLARARQIWGGDVVSLDSGESASAAVVGSACGFAEPAFAQARVMLMGLEFGTVDPAVTMEALRTDQWLRNRPDQATPERMAQVKRALMDCFYVDDDDWRAMVWGQARLSVHQALVTTITD